MKALAFAFSIALSVSITAIAHADEYADIKQRGTLVCGSLGTFEPFSFQDPKTRETVGYEVDLCQAVAKQLGVKLELKLLAVEARIPELSQGRVDIISAALGYLDERAQQIDYSLVSFVSRQMLMVKSSSGITSFEQLKDRKVSAPKGSTSEKYVRALLPSATILTFQDPPTAFLALEQSKVQAIALGELGLVKFQQQTGGLDLLKQPLAVEYWGLGVRKNEPAFLTAVNDTLKKLEASGEGAAIFDKWLGKNSPYKLERTFRLNEAVRNPVLDPKS